MQHDYKVLMFIIFVYLPQLFPLMQPLHKTDLSIIPEPADEPDTEPVISSDEHGVTRSAMRMLQQITSQIQCACNTLFLKG